MSEKKPYLILRTDFYEGGILSFLADRLADALRASGESVEVFSYTDNDFSAITQYIGRSFKAIIGFHSNLFQIYLKSANSYLFDMIDGVKLDWWFDHPMTFIDQTVHTPKDYYVLTLDENYVRFIKEMMPGVKDAFFLPPAGTEADGLSGEGSGVPSGEEPGGLSGEEPGGSGSNPTSGMRADDLSSDDFYERPYELSFLARFWDWRPLLDEVRAMPEEPRGVAEDFYESMKSQPHRPADELLRDVLSARAYPDDRDTFLRWFKIMRPLMLNVACYYREKVLQEILDAGLKVDLFSPTWNESQVAGHPNIVMHPEVPSAEGIGVYGRSRMSLNVMTWHKMGATERTASILLSGAVLVSDRTTVLDRELVNGRDAVLFGLDDLGALPDRILAARENLPAIAAAGRSAARERWTWERCVERLKEIVGECDSQK